MSYMIPLIQTVWVMTDNKILAMSMKIPPVLCVWYHKIIEYKENSVVTILSLTWIFSDIKAHTSQLQMTLPTGTELGKIYK